MSDIVIKKLKKYLFLISLVLLLVFTGHLVYKYLYKDAKEVPVEGGVVSEWIIWDFPHLNPLILSTDHNKYIISLLYRSLLSYDIEEWKITNDLASCDLSNLLYIECYLENNITWSNGEEITISDIVATFNLFKKSDVNPVMASLLQETDIEEKDGSIIFSNTKKDINFLNVFFQPVLPANTINNLWTEAMSGNFSALDSIYSGRYIIGSIDQDETVWITKITLEKNTNYFQNNMFIDTLILKLFKDNTHFLKHKNSVNIFNDKQNILWDSIPRLEPREYVLPQFVSLFLNTEKITSLTLRNTILQTVDRNEVIAALWEDSVQEIKNSFLTETEIEKEIESDIPYTMAQLGYTEHKLLLDEALKEAKALEEENKVVIVDNRRRVSDEATTIIKEPAKPARQQAWLSIITSPTEDKFNFISEDNVLLKWTVADSEVTAIYVNDYKLNGFSQWDSVFYYRLIKGYDSIIEWENTYKIYFEKDWKKELVDEIVYFYYSDTEKLQNIKDEFFTGKEAVTVEVWALNNSELEANTDNEFKTPEIIKLESLDTRFYYNEDIAPFALNLLYINSDKAIFDAVNTIKEQLEAIGIQVNLVESDVSSLTKDLRDEKVGYDMVVIGVNLWYFDFNMFPYLHSSQIESGYNFSNIKNLNLDILLEEVRGNNLSKTKILELEEKVLEIVKEEQIMKTLYSPKLRLLVDKNIENYSLASYIPDNIYRLDPLINSYITKKKTIDKENKSPFDFIKFLFTSLFK